MPLPGTVTFCCFSSSFLRTAAQAVERASSQSPPQGQAAGAPPPGPVLQVFNKNLARDAPSGQYNLSPLLLSSNKSAMTGVKCMFSWHVVLHYGTSACDVIRSHGCSRKIEYKKRGWVVTSKPPVQILTATHLKKRIYFLMVYFLISKMSRTRTLIKMCKH